MRHGFGATVGCTIGAIASSALWLALGPTSAGGSLTAVTVRGTSMSPGIVAGDLVVVRHDARYHVGDVVAHRAGPGDTLVLHRVVRVEGDRLVLRGDANHHDDEIQPATSDVIGRLVLRIAGGERLVRPALTALAGLALVVVPVAIIGTPVARPRRRRRHATTAP